MRPLCDWDAVDLRRAIDGRDVSPVEILESCLERIAAVNPAVNAFVTIDEAGARAAAKAAEAAVLAGEATGLLHGLPVGVKDLTETGGMRTTFGSLLHRDYVPPHDERLVAALRDAGAVVLGKTNTPEFGAGANTTNQVFGPTVNPFALDLTPAGSSGGSAVALATGMAPLATGSDMGGSLRTPAAFCGVVGFRPTPGLVPSERKRIGLSGLGVNGPMARTVADVALQLAAMVADDPRDPLSAPLSGPHGTFDLLPLPRVDLSRLRVAFSTDLGFAAVSAESRRAFAGKIAAIAPLFAEAFERDPALSGAHEVFAVLRAEEFLAQHLDSVRNAPERVGPNIRANVAEGLRYTAGDTAKARVRQTDIYRGFQRFFDDVDLLICPAAAVSPFPYRTMFPATIDGESLPSYIHWLGLSYGLTITGHPVACIPCGLDERGLPFGVQICGRRRADAFVLAAGEALETAFKTLPGCARPTSDIAMLTAAPPAPGPEAFPAG